MRREVGWPAYYLVKDALVELPLGRATLPELVVAVVETLPVLAELGEAVRVDVLDAVPVAPLSAPSYTKATPRGPARLSGFNRIPRGGKNRRPQRKRTRSGHSA